MHGKRDSIVPFHMGEKLFKLANEPKYSHFTDDDDHMMKFNEELLKSLSKFLNFNTK